MLSKIFFQYLNAIIAWVIYILSFKHKEEIWIFGGINGELYTDNAQVFYEYILKNYPKIKVFWIARKNSCAYFNAKGIVIEKGSIKNYLLVYKSKATLFSDTFNSDIAPSLYIMPFIKIFYNKTFKVRLNHGTIAFKKMPKDKGFIQKIRDNILLNIDLNTASTDLEVKVMSTYMRKGTVFLTGSARNDNVKNLTIKNKIIFIAPTWRDWLYKNNSIKSTNFYFQYTKLLENSLLIDIARKNNIKIKFFLHHLLLKFKKEFEYLNNDVIEILSPKDKLSNYIMGSSLMITDYSSICAERFYLRKPIIFFQFDQERYEYKMGSYINLKNDTFGDVYTNIDDLVDRIISSIENNFPVSEKQIEGEKYFVHFKDKNNCNRIFKEIENLKETK